MKSHVFKFPVEIKVNLATYFFVSLSKYINFSQQPLSLLTKSTTSISSLQQFTFGFIDFNWGWRPLPPKYDFFN